MDFVDYLSRFKFAGEVSVQDRADRLNYLYTNLVLLIFTTVITLKQYMLKPISCYMNADPGGTNLLEYVENHCWVEGTLPHEERTPLPDNDEDWQKLDAKKILYYQWVPFVLVLQCLMFYTPRLLWLLMCYNRTGTDLQHLLRSANDALHADQETRQKTVLQISATLEEMLFKNREIRSGARARMVHRVHRACSIAVASKRMGTWVVGCYLLIKWLYLFNAVGQLFFMQRFLNFNSNDKYSFLFGLQVIRNIVQGRDWRVTQVFPRVTYCYTRVRTLNNLNSVTAQCVLPVNMLNEKIYIFLWFWISLVALATLISIPVWMRKIASRGVHRAFVKKHLKIGKLYARQDDEQLNSFTKDFLRHDGVFILQMLSLNCGDLITADVVSYLWSTFKAHYQGHTFLRCTSHPQLNEEEGGYNDAFLAAPPYLKNPEDSQLKPPPTPLLPTKNKFPEATAPPNKKDNKKTTGEVVV